MDTLLQMRTAIQSDLVVNSGSTLFNETTIDLAINRAYRKCAALFRWPELEDAKKTSTVSGQNYYDYPDSWQPDSIWKVKVDGVRYGEEPDGSPITFNDFLDWTEDNANDTDKKWSTQNRRFFITPTPTSNGNNNICVWGQKTVSTLSADSDVTIFSYSMPECNEAIVLEARAILEKRGGDMASTQFSSVQAKEILAQSWRKILQNQQKYEKLQPMFEVPDFFGRRNSSNTIANFDLDL